MVKNSSKVHPISNSTSQKFRHPYDTMISAGLRFRTELIARIGGPMVLARIAPWLVVVGIAILMGLPSIFSTPNDKRTVIVPTPGSLRVLLELFLYFVAGVSPWLLWPVPVAALLSFVVLVSMVFGVPRFLWLINGAPVDENGNDKGQSWPC